MPSRVRSILIWSAAKAERMLADFGARRLAASKRSSAWRVAPDSMSVRARLYWICAELGLSLLAASRAWRDSSWAPVSRSATPKFIWASALLGLAAPARRKCITADAEFRDRSAATPRRCDASALEGPSGVNRERSRAGVVFAWSWFPCRPSTRRGSRWPLQYGGRAR